MRRERWAGESHGHCKEGAMLWTYFCECVLTAVWEGTDWKGWGWAGRLVRRLFRGCRWEANMTHTRKGLGRGDGEKLWSLPGIVGRSVPYRKHPALSDPAGELLPEPKLRTRASQALPAVSLHHKLWRVKRAIKLGQILFCFPSNTLIWNAVKN